MYNNKTAIITGAASGIGKALAHKCGAEGMQVVLADINATALEQLAGELEALGTKAVPICMDVSQTDDAKRLVTATFDAFGRADMLFNNAGIVGPIGPIWTIPPQNLKQIFDINLQGMINILQAFIPSMLEQDSECHIVNTAAMSGLFTYPYFSAYQITKHAIIAMTEGLYHDLATQDSKIKVAVLCPGWVKTRITTTTHPEIEAQLTDADIQWLIKFAKKIKKGISPEKIAELTFAALKENQFYILTHPEMMEAVTERFQGIVNAKAPAQFEL